MDIAPHRSCAMPASVTADADVVVRRSWKRPLAILIVCAFALAIGLWLVRMDPAMDSSARWFYLVTSLVAPFVAIWASCNLLVAIMSRRWTPYAPHMVLCVVTLLIYACTDAGDVVALPLMILLFWVPYSFFAVLYTPSQFVPRLIKFGLWSATIAIVLGFTSMHRTAALAIGTGYAHAVEQYKRAHGDYPRNLQAASLSDPGFRELHYYYPQDEKAPMLMVPDAFDPFDEWFYRFEDQTWEFRPD